MVALFCINVCLMKEKTLSKTLSKTLTIEKVSFCDKIQVQNRFLLIVI